jgi:hypothetical protein
MEVMTELPKLIGQMGPGLAIGVLGIWAAIKKDAQCTALMERLAAIAEKQAVSNEQVATSLNGVRDAIRIGTRS